MQQSHLPTAGTLPATKTGRHRQDSAEKVALACLGVTVIPAQHGFPSGHTRHDGSQNAQAVAS